MRMRFGDFYERLERGIYALLVLCFQLAAFFYGRSRQRNAVSHRQLLGLLSQAFLNQRRPLFPNALQHVLLLFCVGHYSMKQRAWFKLDYQIAHRANL